MKNARKTAKEKLLIIEDAKTNGVVQASRTHGVSFSSIKTWMEKYALQGESGLVPGNRFKASDNERKLLHENEQLKLIIAEKELELRIKSALLKKTTFQ